MSHFLFKDRDGQTPLPPELHKGLRHKNIQTMGELDEYEEENISDGLLWLSKQNKDCLSYNFWLQLHKKLFGNVWSWAGQVRTHELNNPDFLMPHEIWPSFKKLEDDLCFWIENGTYSNLEIAARFHERLLTIHPFANGNGRFSRILIEYFCKKKNIQIPSWGISLQATPKKRREVYINAVERARKDKKFEHLINFIFDKP